MSSFSSFLVASKALGDEFQCLGASLGGADDTDDTTYWLDSEKETVVKGHIEWGKDLYTLTPEMADVGLLPALLKIVRSEKPGLSLEECTSVALERAKAFGFVPIPHTQSSSASECLVAPIK